MLQNGNYLYKIPFRAGTAVLKVYYGSRSWFSCLIKSLENVLLAGQTSYMPKTRLRIEMECLALWRKHGFRVFDTEPRSVQKAISYQQLDWNSAEKLSLSKNILMKHILLVAALSAALMGCRDSEVTNTRAEAEPHGQAMAADLGPLLKTFFEAVDPPARQTAIAAIRAAAPDLRDVERGLRQGRNYPADARKGWQIFTHTGSDGKARPYHVYIPKGYDPARKHPAIVQLHGGVSRANLLTEAELTQMRADVKDADRYGWIQIIPLGQRGATWFDRVGMANVQAQLAAVKRRYNVDEDRVFLGGFSDGGSGALIMGLYYPTPWAGLIALSGSIIVAIGAPDEAFPANLSNRPVHAANGGIDPLYPSALQKIFIDQLREQGARIAWTDYPASGHDGSYMAQEDPKSNQFVLKTARDPSPRHVVWETVNPKVGRCDWVRIDEVRDVGNNRGPEPSNLVLVGPPQFAIIPDLGFAGPGLRVRQVPPGSLAQTAGLQSDDVLTRLDGVEIKTTADVQNVGLTRILTMKKGDVVRGEYRRGETNHSFEFPVPELPRVPLFKRTGPAGRVDVKAMGNRVEVTVRSVARYTLLIRREMFDLDRPIQLFTNGAESFNARVKPDLDFMLEQAGEDDDRSAVYAAKIEIQVLPGEAPGRP